LPINEPKQCPKYAGPFLTVALFAFIQGHVFAQAASFETVPSGVYTAGSVLAGWTVASNEVGIVTDPKGAYNGANYLALTSGHIVKTFATQPGVVYQLQFHGKGPGLTDWWPGDSAANDIIGNNNGTLQNMTFDAGKVGQAFAFNEHNSQVDFGTDIANVGTNDFTVDFWIKQPAGLTGQYGILEKRQRCDCTLSELDIHCGPNWSLPTARSGQLFMDVAADGVINVGVVVAHKLINDGGFHHAAFVRNGLTLAIYIDGILDSKVTTAGIADVNNSDKFRAGQSSCVGVDGTLPFVGELDELDLFNRALSPAEIYAIYLAGSDGKYSPVSTLLPNFQLTVDGVMTNTIVLTTASGPWQLFTNSFAAKKSQTTIEFEGNSLGVLFDDIQLIQQ
jgi:hypothetical protein